MSDVRQRLRSWRGVALVVLVIVVATASGVLLARPTGAGALDPTSPAPDGARALAQVLRSQGVEVRDARRFDDVRAAVDAAAPDVTLVLARPDRLAPGRGGDLRELVADGGTTLVVVGADNGLLSDLDAPVGAAPVSDPAVVEPGCSAATPTRAGDAVLGGFGYGSQPAAAAAAPVAACYRVDGQPTYVELARTGGGATVLLGSGAALTNDRLTDAGDAALAIGTLGRHRTVVWWTPDPLDGVASDEPASLSSLLPDGVRFGAVQLLVVVLVLVLWRGRRFGRLVPEPLPVVVRAAETTVGRGRLYRRARARGRAAQVLRAATVRRLAVRCGLPRTADVEQVVAAASVLTRRPAGDVSSLLVGPDPRDDAHLVTLARDLQSLEREAQRP
ncbi:DUF4350 domain-containing protein [Angustibacter sp. Root456]|uniref:DUF4350 domain-containing protein n=1 Tax=Angustibacter sp. Root456 TaxID=1736539 RepID=UPI00070009AA|nr:DUF4350 domain-containing protein [Angustibacter sp. Root456]KQX69885.1 hypothetical protein ASD06_02450 [Angustibacter sp. Root456]